MPATMDRVEEGEEGHHRPVGREGLLLEVKLGPCTIAFATGGDKSWFQTPEQEGVRLGESPWLGV